MLSLFRSSFGHVPFSMLWLFCLHVSLLQLGVCLWLVPYVFVCLCVSFLCFYVNLKRSKFERNSGWQQHKSSRRTYKPVKQVRASLPLFPSLPFFLLLLLSPTPSFPTISHFFPISTFPLFPLSPFLFPSFLSPFFLSLALFFLLSPFSLPFFIFLLFPHSALFPFFLHV